jgi:hypothetical protein
MRVPTASTVRSLAVLSADDVYAVTDAQLLHYDGTTWTITATSTLGGLTSMWAADPQNLFITDSTAHVYRRDLSTVETTVPHPPSDSSAIVRLYGIWGGGLDNIVAVGSFETIAQRDAVTWTYDQPQTPTTIFNAVWGQDGTVFVAGTNLIKKRESTTWTVVQPTAGKPAATDKIAGIWGASPTDLYFVGTASGAPPTGVIYHFDGSAFTAVTPPNTPSMKQIWGRSGSSVYAVGDAGTILHFDGADWTETIVNAGLEAVAGIGNDVFVGGANGAVWKLSEP